MFLKHFLYRTWWARFFKLRFKILLGEWFTIGVKIWSQYFIFPTTSACFNLPPSAKLYWVLWRREGFHEGIQPYNLHVRLVTEGTCISRILIFRDKTFNSGKFCYHVLKPHLAWNRQEVVFGIVHKILMN